MAIKIDNKKNIVLMTAGILGLLTGALAYAYLKQAPAKEKTSVMVAKTTITKGSIIFSDMLQLRPRTRESIPADAVMVANDAIGKYAFREIKAGETILKKDLVDKDKWISMSFNIPSGYRAVTVGVDPVSSVGYFMKPDDHVDVIVTYKKSDLVYTETILQNVLLLAVGQQVEPDTDTVADSSTSQKNTATLLVRLDEAEKLINADNRGKIRLVLRRITDTGYDSTSGIRSHDDTVTVTPAPDMEMQIAPNDKSEQEAGDRTYESGKSETAITQKPETKPDFTIIVVKGTESAVVEVPDGRAKDNKVNSDRSQNAMEGE